jgi:Pretoxin HINT domain
VGTKVLTSNGSVRDIEAIKTGDWVKSWDPKTQKETSSYVVNVLQSNKRNKYATLAFETRAGPETITATSGHLLLGGDGKWRQIGTIAVGERIVTVDGPALVLSNGQSAGVGMVYDLTVATTSTFYVTTGPTAVLVHNQDACPIGSAADAKIAETAAIELRWDRFGKTPNKIPKKIIGRFKGELKTPHWETVSVTKVWDLWIKSSSQSPRYPEIQENFEIVPTGLVTQPLQGQRPVSVLMI